MQMSSLLSVCRAQNLLEEDSLEAVPEEDQPLTRPPAHPQEEAVALIAVAADRKKSSSAGGEGRKKSSKADPATGKRRKSSLFLRLKNFKSLPSISLPRIFNLSKLLKKEKSQPIMTLAAGGGGGGGAAAVSSLLLAASVSPKSSVELSAAKAEFWLGEGRIDAVAVAGGWKRRRKGRIRTVVVVKEVREIKCSSHRLLDLKRSLIDSLCQSWTNPFYLFADFTIK